MTRRRAASVAGFFTSMVVLWYILTYVAMTYYIYVPVFREISDAFAWIPFTTQVQSLAVDMDSILDGLTAADKKDVAHADDIENGFPSQERVDNLILARRRIGRFAVAIGKSVTLGIAGYFALWILLNTATVLHWIVLIVFWLIIFARFHQAQPIIAIGFWVVLALALTIVYMFPYRAMRKVLVVYSEGRYKPLGRVVFIRGANAWGEYPQSIIYPVWFGWRRVKNRLSRNRRPWKDIRPSPHEIPFGNPHYLRGGIIRKAMVPDPVTGESKEIEHIERFRHAITLRPNTKRLIAGIRHPIPLFMTGRIETTMFEHRVVGDGFKVVLVGRQSVDDAEHYELRRDFLRSHERRLEPYYQEVRSGLKRSAGNVSDGVLSDPELGKDVARDYTQPAFESYALQMGFEFDEKGNVIKKPKGLEPK